MLQMECSLCTVPYYNAFRHTASLGYNLRGRENMIELAPSSAGAGALLLVLEG
jgi:hypothetical protein